MKNSRFSFVSRDWKSRFALLLFTASAFAQQPAPTPPPTPDPIQTFGRQAVLLVVRQNIIDSTVRTGPGQKSLPSNGKWTVGLSTSPLCPTAGQPCLKVLYTVADVGVVCTWIVQIDSAKSGQILAEDSQAANFFIRQLNDETVRSLVVLHPDAKTPAIAAAAHVSGDVTVNVTVSMDGRILDAVVGSGPDMLKASALDAARAWTFKPFLSGGTAVRWSGSIYVKFSPYSHW